MKLPVRPFILAAILSLAACGSEPAPPPADGNAAEAGVQAAAEPAQLADCPFRATRDWAASHEGGRLLVTGRVDLQMAGFRPGLTPREGTSGAFDLALVPEPQAAVTDLVRYESTGSAPSQIEIWCGGDRIAGVSVIRTE